MFHYVPPEDTQKLLGALDALNQVYRGKIFAMDNLVACARNLSFANDPKFSHAFQSTVRSDLEQSLIWRLHTLTWAAAHGLFLEGDFVECGVLRAFSATVICKFLDFQNVNKTFWLYDTFAGLSAETSNEMERTREQDAYPKDREQWLRETQARVQEFPNVKIIKGVVPFSFDGASPEKIAFLHIDMNAAKAEVMALEKLFDRVTPGGMIILDDFGWLGHREQMVAHLEFMKTRGHQVLELPTGQGLVVKH